MYSFGCGCFVTSLSVFVWLLNREVNENLGKEFCVRIIVLPAYIKERKLELGLKWSSGSWVTPNVLRIG